MQIQAQANIIPNKEAVISSLTPNNHAPKILKSETLDQDVNFTINTEYDIPVTVPTAPHYLIDPSIFKSYG